MPETNLKHLRIVDITTYQPIKRELGNLSASIEYKLLNPDSKRMLITEEEVFTKLREIISLVEKL